MQISNLSNNFKTNFGSLTTHPSFYDTAVALRQYNKTSASYDDSFTKLSEASKNKDIEIRSLGDLGAVVVETDGMNNITRYIAKNFKNAIQCMKDATLILDKENAPEKPRRKPFQGNV